MNQKQSYIVNSRPTADSRTSSFLTDDIEEAIEQFKAEVRLGHWASIEVEVLKK